MRHPLTRRRILGLGALALLPAGCTSRSGSLSDAHTLVAATADDVKSLDPALAYDTWSTAIVHACTRRLVDYDQQAKLLPDVAQQWDISPDGKTYTFILGGGRFSDGTWIQAEHFHAALQRVQDPKVASPGASFYEGITAVEAPNPRTLILRLKNPDPTLLNVLGMTFAAPIQPGKDLGQSASGPYVLERYDPGTRVLLRSNPQDSSGTVERIEVQLRVQNALQMTRFRNGEVDLLPALPPAEYARVMNDAGERSRVVQGVVNQTWYFGMNTTRPPWNDVRVRRAALLAIDRKRQALIGAGQPANGILPPHVPGYDPSRRLPDPDPAAARRLLAEAGYPNGLPKHLTTVLWLAGNAEHSRHAELIQADLAAAGIPVELHPVTLSQYLSGYKRSADCWYGGWYPDFPDAGNFLEPVLHGRSIKPGGSANAARYDNPRVNALLDEAHGTPLGPQRNALYKGAEDLILQDVPWAPLYFEVETRYFRPGISGVEVDPVWRQRLTGISKPPRSTRLWTDLKYFGKSAAKLSV